MPSTFAPHFRTTSPAVKQINCRVLHRLEVAVAHLAALLGATLRPSSSTMTISGGPRLSCTFSRFNANGHWEILRVHVDDLPVAAP